MTTKTQTEKEDKNVKVLYAKNKSGADEEVTYLPKYIFDFFVKEYQEPASPDYWVWTEKNKNKIGFGMSPCEFEEEYDSL